MISVQTESNVGLPVGGRQGICFFPSTRKLVGPLGEMKLTKSESVVLRTLVVANMETVSFERFFEVLYAGDIALSAKTCVKVFVMRLRFALERVGAGKIIRSVSGVGYELTSVIQIEES